MHIRRLAVAVPLVLASALAHAPAAHAEAGLEPRTFKTPSEAEAREAGWTSGLVVDLSPEYRTRVIHVDPLELSGVLARDVSWAEQRLRLDLAISKPGVASVFVQADILDGVLYGDNGDFGREPNVTSGLGIASKQPNLAGWRVGLVDTRYPLDIDSYGPVLVPVAPLEINFAYGEVMLPFGVLRVGRQPITDVATITLNDGRSGRNRWGASTWHESADRILFGTKISEAWHLARKGREHVVDKSVDDGVFMGVIYDFLVNDRVHVASDDLRQVAGQLEWKEREASWFGLDWKNVYLSGALSYRWDDRYQTGIYGVPFRGGFDVGPMRFRGDLTFILGESQELSAGFGKLTGKDPVDQEFDAMGARAVVDYDVGDFTLSAEWAYATGDDDPRPSTPMKIFSFARDSNLGLLLFEHVLAFQSARSAAVGIENLKQLEAESFPLTEIATEGRVTNVNAIFPQVFYSPIPSLRLKAGALFAFSQTLTVDPIQTTLAWDGQDIADDRLNYHGGKPGNYWGTELDLGVEWNFRDMFYAAVEGAYLLPGSGLRDENGDAVPSWMIESRFTFRL